MHDTQTVLDNLKSEQGSIYVGICMGGGLSVEIWTACSKGEGACVEHEENI